MTAPLNVAVAGLGTVGGGVVKLLAAQRDLLAQRCGREIKVVAVSARDLTKDRGLPLDGVQRVADPVALASLPDVHAVVEVIGGAEGPARAAVEAAIAHGKHVVTANKALLAHHGARLAAEAEAKGLCLNWEAAVAGGIPIIKALREGLAANRISRVYGILNGTCNYILTTMEATGRSFGDVLADAQRLGYAEADPSFDIGGIDAAHKLALLASLAFGAAADFGALSIEGIEQITAADIAFARELGFRIKLLGIAEAVGDGVRQRVHPCLVPLGTPIADVDGVFNAVVAEGDFVGKTFFQGRGAGEGPTASAVVADLADIARGQRVWTFGRPAKELAKPKAAPLAERVGAVYLNLSVVDRPGVMAAVTAALAKAEVSIESMIQRGRAPGEPVSVVMVLHETREAQVAAALKEIGAQASVAERPRMIRIERF